MSDRAAPGTKVFEVSDFPKKRSGGGGGGKSGLRAAEQIQVAIDNPGRVFCVRQYESGGAASGYAKAVREHYPEAEVMSRYSEDIDAYGVFVRFPGETEVKETEAF